MPVKILLADDSNTIQKIVHQTFEHEPVELILLSNGDAAIRRLEEDRPDLVLADIFMPGKNGYEVCEFIKQHPALSDIPVVLLIGAFEPFDVKEAERVHADGHLEKPFASKMLLETARRFIAWESKASISEEIPERREETPPPTSPAGTPWHSDIPFRPTEPVAAVALDEPDHLPASLESPTQPDVIAPFEETLPLLTESRENDFQISEEPIAVPVEGETPLEISHLDVGPASQAILEEPIQPDSFTPASPFGESTIQPATEMGEAAESRDHRISGEMVSGASAESLTPEATPVPSSSVDEFAEFQRHLTMHSDNAEAAPIGPVEVAGPPIPPSVIIEHEMFPSTMEELMGGASPSIRGSENEISDVPPVEIPAPNKAVPSADVSQEMIEAIAQRVIEKMSSRVIEEIAWEVVPEMTEALLRKNLSEKK